MRSNLAVSACVALVACLAACAEGGGETTFDPGDGGFGGEGGEGGATSSTTTSSTTTSTTSTGTGGEGGEGGEGGGGSDCDFSSANACNTAELLLQIDGDKGSHVRTATGNASRWFQVYVYEAVSSVFSYPSLSYTVTLDSPPGTNYDLFVYTGNKDQTNCLATPVKGVGNNPEQVQDKWSDSAGSDDSRWISIEVRYIDGEACSPFDLWTLTVAGNTH